MTTSKMLLEEELASINRPRMVTLWANNKNPDKSRNEVAEWDKQNPLLRNRHFEIVNALEDIERAENSELLAREKDVSRRDALLKSGVTLRAVEVLDKEPSSEAIKSVDSWLGGLMEFLLIVGPPGTGKTVAAAYAVKKAIECDKQAKFVRAADLSRAGLWGDGSEQYRELSDYRGILVIDDLGIEAMTEIWRQNIEGIIDARYGAKLALVMTTNLTPTAFKARYGERISDRIRECGKVASIAHTSMRKSP